MTRNYPQRKREEKRKKGTSRSPTPFFFFLTNVVTYCMHSDFFCFPLRHGETCVHESALVRRECAVNTAALTICTCLPINTSALASASLVPLRIRRRLDHQSSFARNET